MSCKCAVRSCGAQNAVRCWCAGCVDLRVRTNRSSFFVWLSPQRCSMQAINQRMTQVLAGMQPAWEHCEQLLLFVMCSNLSSPAELRAACDSMTKSGAARWTSYSCCMVQPRGNSMPMSCGGGVHAQGLHHSHGATCLEHAPTPCCPHPHSRSC